MKGIDIFYITENADRIFRELRWPQGPECPICGSHHIYACANGKYKCAECGKTFSITTNTILHGSHIGIKYWLVALYLMLDGKGISSVELSRKIGVTQKTAYYMLMRLRIGLNQDDVFLENEIAMDEEYMGGTFSRMALSKRQALLRRYNLPLRPKTTREKIAVANAVNSRYKTPVYGLNDGNKIVLKVVHNPVRPADVEEVFRAHTKGLGTAVSDCSKLYNQWESRTNWDISCNNHSIGQFVTEDGRSSNRIEGTFSWNKRSSLPAFVHMKRPYLQLYLNEFAFRWNTRDLDILDRLSKALGKIKNTRANWDTLRHLNEEEYKLYNEEEWGNPWEVFECLGGLTSQVNIGGIVYRYEDYLEYKERTGNPV